MRKFQRMLKNLSNEQLENLKQYYESCDTEYEKGKEISKLEGIENLKSSLYQMGCAIKRREDSINEVISGKWECKEFPEIKNPFPNNLSETNNKQDQ